MVSFIMLYSQKQGEINKFLSSFYNTNIELEDSLKWKKDLKNPVEATELIGTFVDNIDKYSLNLWLCLDKNLYIHITEKNADTLIKYLYERYPY